MNDLFLFAVKDAALAGLAATAFAFCLGVPRRHTLICGVCAALGHSTQAVLLALGFSLAFSTFSGATLIGFLGIIFARKFFIPRVVFTVPGIIPMLPGTFVFNALLALVQASAIGATTPPSIALEALSNFMRAAVIICALAAGIGLPNLLIGYKKPEL